jgi:hypothetical protein
VSQLPAAWEGVGERRAGILEEALVEVQVKPLTPTNTPAYQEM